MSGVQTIEVKAGEEDQRLDRWFKRQFPHISHGALEKYLRKGEVRVDGKRSKSSFRLNKGMQVRVPPLPDPGAQKPANRVSAEDAALLHEMVIYKDARVIVLNKPAGLAVQGGTKTHRHIDGMLDALAKKGERPRLVHRLDRDTSGVLLLGRDVAATAALAKAFQSRRAQKTYWALTLGVPRPEKGLLSGYMKKGFGEKGRELMMTARHGDPDASYARTRYAVLARAGQRAAWVALRPETGRTHQLRFHMAGMGFAIAGDRKYICDRPDIGGLEEQLHLHARAITLPHPDGGVFSIDAPLPKHMKQSFEALGFSINEISEDPFEE
jgi:23S rRNA pseudouridine955/2504/2580 synthase